MSKAISLLTVTVLLVVVAVATYRSQLVTSAPDGTQQDAAQGSETATVEFVVDGDTVDLSIDGTIERVRLIGIDTPETVNPQTPTQCFGAQASAALADLLPEGSTVRIERDNEARDRYDRLLLYLYRSDDDLFVNEWMVENGFASAISYRPNTAHEVTFSQAQQRAQTSNVGLWAVCDGPDQPLDPTTS